MKGLLFKVDSSFVISLNQEKEIGDAIIITITAPLTFL